MLLAGGSRKLFWEGHIGLESPKTMKRDAEVVDERGLGMGLPPPQLTRKLGECHKLPQRGLGAPAANDMWALHTEFCAI